jgi:DNA helicase-2/ATP-dependent DNA helicase PcrA
MLLERMFDDELLNPEQRAAATHGDGPLLIVAGAGTGKTTTLAARVAFLLERGVRAERILLLTFTRRAAREMLHRAEYLSGHRDAGRVWGGTFHAVGNRLLRLHGRALGLSPDFTVLDQGESADVFGLLREELGFAAKERRFPRKETVAAIYSRTVNAATPLEETVQRHFPWCTEEVEDLRTLVHAYTERKRRQRLLDFDDLLLFWRALVTSEVTGPQVAAMFDHVLVDEYQDTNALQADILEGLRPQDSARNLTVVGDDAQAIYGFRAATVRNILGFPDRFPGATVVKLERNYRSSAPLLAASNAVIARSPQRHEKTLWTDLAEGTRPVLQPCVDEQGQVDAVCRAILDHRERGVSLRAQAVLFRAAHHSDLLEVELARRNIPFAKYGGLKFLEAAHVKDALALLRVLENPWDEVAWFRVLQLPEGIGPATARRLMDTLGVHETQPAASPLAAFLEQPVEVPTAAAGGVRELRGALAGCADEDLLAPAAQLERLRAYLEPVVRRRYDSAAARLADLEQLALLAQGYEARGRFLAELALDPPASTSDLAGPPVLDDDWLTLTTIHSAKGLEWDVVHVIHASDGNIPSDMATGDDDELEEERRLLYVAMTRARHALHVTFPQRYHHTIRRERSSTALVSRFLDHDEVRATFDLLAPPERVPQDDGPAISGVASVDGLLADLFG